MSTSQTIAQLMGTIGEIDRDIQELSNMSMAITTEASNADAEFDSGQDFSSTINGANTCIDDALTELKRTRSSLQGIVYALH